MQAYGCGYFIYFDSPKKTTQMNNLVIYNEAEINSVEICVLPPLFKVKVAMDSDTDATVTITDINDAEDFASVCIETNRNEFSNVQFTDKERLCIGREVARCIAADIALFVGHGIVPYECYHEHPTFDLFRFSDKWENDLAFGIRKIYFARRDGSQKR